MESTRSRLGNGLAVGATGALLARDLDLATLVSYWGPRSPLVVAATLLLALLWMTRLRPLVASATVTLALAWLGVAFTPLTHLAAAGLARHDPERPADAVYVLASRVQDDGELTSSAMSRLVHGLELLGQEQAQHLVLGELPPPHAAYEPGARRLMSHLGLKQELLTIGPVTNTREEAVALARLFKGRGWRSVLLVTSPTHALRAAATFEREGLVVISSPGMETRFDLETLTFPDERLLAFGTLLHERVGLEFYRSRGWIE